MASSSEHRVHSQQLVAGLDAEESHAGVGHAVQQQDEGAEHDQIGPIGEGEPTQGGIGSGQSDVLRHHLPEDEMEEHHDRE